MRENEQIHQGLFERVPDAIVVIDRDGGIVRVNAQAEALFGYQREELLGKPVEVLIPERFRERHIQHRGGYISEPRRRPMGTGLELLGRRKDGGEFPVDIMLSPVETSEALLIVAVVRDNTERKRAEAEIKTHTRQQAAVARLSQRALAGTDLSVLMDEAVALVAQALEVEYCKVLELLPGGAALLLRAGVGWKEEYVGQATVGAGTDSQAGYTLLSDGPVIVEDLRTETRFRGPPLLLDHGVVSGLSVAIPFQDRPFGVLGAHTMKRRTFTQDDVHFLQAVAHVLAAAIERRQAEDALKASQEYARNVIESSLDMIIAVDKDRKITTFNRAAQETFGYRLEEILGKHVDVLYADPQEGLTVHKTTVESGRCVQEILNRRKNGEVFPSFLSASVLRNVRGEAVGVMGVSRDIAERKQLEQQLFQAQKMEAIGTLAGGIAHDFNNLLTTIIGFAQIALLEKDLSPQLQDYISRIPEQGKRAAHLITQLLTFSRRTVTQRQPMQLLPLVKETVKMLERTVPENIAIRLSVSDELVPVNADPTQIQQILLNLCINASQAMPNGGELTLRLWNVTLDEAYCRRYPYAQPGNYVCLSVRDTGIGMTPDVREHIFEPFFTTKGVGEGTGLGLATVYGIVKMHEGHINVYSEAGQGSEFKVYLPAMEGAATTQKVIPERPVGGVETLLLVEDDATVLSAGQEVLRRLGYTVLTATNGVEAFKVYRAHQDEIALVLADMVMPKMGGKELYEVLVQINPEVRVLLMSGYSLKEEVADLRANGLKGFVQKPFDFNQLGQAVRQALDE